MPRVLLEILRKIRQTMSDKHAGSAKTNKLVNLSGEVKLRMLIKRSGP